MSFSDYIRAKFVPLCLIAVGVIIFVMMTFVAGVAPTVIFVPVLLMSLLTVVWIIWSWRIEDRKFKALEALVASMPEAYLVGELIEAPSSPIERRYYEVMKNISRSAIGAVNQSNKEKEKYYEYVENWIHEIKTPLTACGLILDNGGDLTRIRRELRRADNVTESILYYARMRTAGSDCIIRQISVMEAANNAIKSQMELLIAAHISIETCGDCFVYTDSKTLIFIIKQLLINCAKYCPGCHVVIKAAEQSLTIEDNGPGIPAYEIGRVTERGFTGTDNAGHINSTGMGLYIAKSLCEQMNINLNIESVYGSYTRINLKFHQ